MINTQEERASAEELLLYFRTSDPVRSLSPGCWNVLSKLIVKLIDAKVSFDRSLRPDCHYEPIAAWVNYELDDDDKIVSVTPCEGPQSSDAPVGQLCLVYPNSLEDGVTPYAGAWDGVVGDFHRDEDMLREWWFVREHVFGNDNEGRTDHKGYRFLKANLIVAVPDGDGSEGLPDYIHFAARTPDEMKKLLAGWDEEDYGKFNGLLMGGVPVRLIIREDQGDKPFTGAWDAAPWEDA